MDYKTNLDFGKLGIKAKACGMLICFCCGLYCASRTSIETISTTNDHNDAKTSMFLTASSGVVGPTGTIDLTPTTVVDKHWFNYEAHYRQYAVRFAELVPSTGNISSS